MLTQVARLRREGCSLSTEEALVPLGVQHVPLEEAPFQHHHLIDSARPLQLGFGVRIDAATPLQLLHSPHAVADGVGSSRGG